MQNTFIILAFCSSLILGPALGVAAEKCSVVLTDQSLQSASDAFEELLVRFVVKEGKLPKKKEFLKFAAEAKKIELEDFQSWTKNFSQIAPLFSQAELPYNNFVEAFSLIVSEDMKRRSDRRNEKLTKFKDKLQKKIVNRFPTFFKKNFRAPVRTSKINEFADLADVQQEVFEALFKVKELTALWKKNVTQNKTLKEEMSSMVMSALVRYMKQPDRPLQARVTPRAPTFDELYESLAIKYKALNKAKDDGKFKVEDLKALFGQTDNKFELPSLFKDFDELITKAQQKFPNAFVGYISAQFGTEYHEKTLSLIEEKRGFILTSINNGVTVKIDQLESMIHYSKERDMPILVGVVNQETSFIDQALLDYVDKNPMIRIVTQTLDLGPELQVSSIPISPKNMNVFASMSARTGFDKTTIVFHPQLQMKTHPSPEGHLLPVSYWATGSLSEPLYPYSTPIQGRTSKLAEERHVNSFLVVEKASSDSGLLGMGMRGRWHIRPSEYQADKNNEKKGFVDYGRFYTQNGVQSDGPKVIGWVVGDLHDTDTNLHILKALKTQVMPTFGAPKWISIHDGVDNGAINKLGHHDRKNTGGRSKAAQKGELDILAEHNGYINTLNAMQTAFPDTNMLHIDSNHLYWLPNYLNQRLVDPLNQQFIDQLAYAQTSLGMTPYQFILNEGGVREKLIDAAPPEVRDRLLEKFIPIQDPDRLRILKLGELFAIGPDHRKVYINFHGHQGINGARPSPTGHANSLTRGSMGDSHQPLIIGGIYNAGTITNMKLGYNDGGYSGWGHAVILVLDNGTMQMLYYDSATHRFSQGFDGSFRGADHFTQKPKVIPNTNDIVSGSVGDQWGGVRPALPK